MTPRNLIAAGLDLTASCRKCGRMVRVDLETYFQRGLMDVNLNGRLICRALLGDADSGKLCGSKDIDLITVART